ncbi:zinc-binding dehydrogenase [Noviherbaspirillum galbum]|uniref:Zinc-binding dehydrogenase n=1 Tax=Noviherbaspirillum galbum TaxID=2709383 RepID=A0A6B3SPF4_9BURK|nr:zinc-binding dehydrogenase [Noviherbaspirillum galbum]NEX62511.1 zinc-binding dehydrogenase [Noviherbaspirillum galbum]
MRAAYLVGHGKNDVVRVDERPAPVRLPGEVLVRMHTVSLNRVDLYMRDSGAGITHALPQTLGLDGSGVIEAVDAGEPLLKAGQRVVIHPAIACNHCEFCQRGDVVLCTSVRYLGEHRDGTLSDWISVPAQNVFPMPEHLSFEEGATLGVTYLTAWRMLFTKAQIKPWETVLIFGVGGGVSLAALQLAHLASARTIVTSRDDDKLNKALALGADHGINGTMQDVAKAVHKITNGRGVDVVIENVGQAVWASAMKSLVRGGRLVTCGATTGDQPPADLRRIFIRQLQILGSTLGNFQEFADLLKFTSEKQLRPVISDRFSLDDIHAALTCLESGEQFGKVVVTL